MYKKYIYIILFGTVIFFMEAYINTHKNSYQPQISNHYNKLVDEEGDPSDALLTLLELTNLHHEKSWQSIVNATQNGWLRKPGSERWEMEEITTQHFEAIMNTINELGFLQEYSPSLHEYDHALLLGATVARVRMRLGHLIEQWNKGIRFKNIVILGSERTLSPEVESQELLLNPNPSHIPCKPDWKPTKIPTTEFEMMQMVVEQTAFPEDFTPTFIWINTPNQPTPQGGMRRANTTDNIQLWLTTNPKPGSCIAVSNAPHTIHQHLAVLNALPQQFILETIGVACGPKEKVAVILDTIARCIYQLEENKKSSH